MTQTEFLELLNKYDEEHLSEDDLFEIGVAHKELPLGMKNWSKLNEQLGMPFTTGENYRCWVKQRLARVGELPKNVKMLSNKTVDELSQEEITDELEEQMRDLYKQQVKTRDVHREYRNDIRMDARWENLAQEIKRILITQKPLSLRPVEKIKGTAEAICVISDWHIGCVVDSFYNQFNLEIAKERIAKLRDYTLKYCKQFGVRKIHILNLGDLIEGEIHTTARVTNEMDTIGQIKQASELLSQFVVDIASEVEQVCYRSIADNHSRVIQNYKENLDGDSFVYLIDWILEMKLQLAGVTNVELCFDNLSDNFGLFCLDCGKQVGFSHGHRQNVNTAFQSFVGATKSYVDYIIIGHYHSSRIKEFNAAKVIVNSSLKGTDEYALSKNLFGHPSQTLLVFDDGNDLSFVINLD